MHELASKALFIAQTEILSTKLAEARGWVLHMMEYPTIDLAFTQSGRTTLRLRVNCTGWNMQPPTFRLLSSTGIPLAVSNPPPAEIHPNGSGIFNPNAHPLTGEPFICMRGSREYHTHESHLQDHWDACLRLPGYDIGGLLTQIWHAWLKGTG